MSCSSLIRSWIIEKLAKNVSGSNSLRICSKDLRELIKEPTEYEIEESGEYDLVLVPRV
ncbi:MAG: hypothetical protein U9N73_05760 [Candidatus Auribacterota bacterium]|nr:hypothetical protein [Candidatus Auribacterota bacterium]